LREFLGLLNFYRRFIKNCSSIVQPLTDLLAGSKRSSSSPVSLSDTALTAFERGKNALADASLLLHPVPDAQLQLVVDACDVGVGGVLQQRVKDSWQPLAFFSKTDHRALVYAIQSSSCNHSPRESRQLSYVSEFTTDVRHVSGADNVVADALSRAPIDALTISPAVNFDQLAAAQETDPEIQQLLKDSTSSLTIESVPLPGSSTTVLCDTSQRQPRPVVPTQMRRTVFDSLHTLSHPGVRATRLLITARFVWPSMSTDIGTWVRECLSCQRAKIQRHTRSALGKFPTPEFRFDHVHIDLVGPLPPSRGYTYLLTCVDRYTRWPEVIPLSDISSLNVAFWFLFHWIARFGPPSTVTTDRGGQFESALFQSFTDLLGCSRIRTTSYHPQANGLVERFHRQLKSSIRSMPSPQFWIESLPFILLGIRSSVKADSTVTPCSMLYGCDIRLPGDFFVAPSVSAALSPNEFVARLKRHMQDVRPIASRHSQSAPVFIPKDLMTSDMVFLRNDTVRKPLTPPYDGPYKVIRRSEKYFEIIVRDKSTVVSVDRLKPAHVSAT